jgi:hypothetical protein
MPREDVKAWAEEFKAERFDSKKEALTYIERRAEQDAGKIMNLKRQPSFWLEVNGQRICPRRFKLDFEYLRIDNNPTGKYTIEDVKGLPMRDWKIKWNLVKALYPEYDFIMT